MRFLLYPKSKKIPTSILLSSNKRRQPNHSSNYDTVIEKVTGSKNNHNHDRKTANATENKMIKQIWGQQCNENCGCIIQFQCHIDMKSQRIIDISYIAKTLLTTSFVEEKNRNAINQQEKKLQQLRSQKQPRAIVTTTKGRPMLRQCHCTTVHTISNMIVQYVLQHQLRYDQLYNHIGNFSSMRSSTSFRDTVLRTHSHLNNHTRHCYDMIEDAITAMMKGYIPLSRHQEHTYLSNYNNKKQKMNHMFENHDIIQQYVDHYDDHIMTHNDNENDVSNDSENNHEDNYNSDNDRIFYLRKNKQSSRSRDEKQKGGALSSSSLSISSWLNSSSNTSTATPSLSGTTTQYPFGTVFNLKDNNYNNHHHQDSHEHHNGTASLSSSSYFSYNFYPVRNRRSSSYSQTTLSMYDMILAKQDEIEKRQEEEEKRQQMTHQYHYHKSMTSIRDWVAYVDEYEYS